MSSSPFEARYRIDPSTGEERMLARFRSLQRCRSCKSSLSASSFGLSRILKRDYECRRCHALRCSRERLYGTRGREARRRRAVNTQAKEVTP